MTPFKLRYCKIDDRHGRFKKFCELFLGIKFEDLPYDKETNPDLNFIEATIPDSIVTSCAILFTEECRNAPGFISDLRESVRDKIKHATFLAEHMTIHEADERVAIMSMHRSAEAYEMAARAFAQKREIHNMHFAMDNARCLRTAANILDRTAANGG